ncbi:hypothetical protein AgCh_023802 [Apium graveolens]
MCVVSQYVADTWENDEKACSPFEVKIYEETHDVLEPQGTSRRLTAQLSTLKLCPSIEHKASGDTTEGEGITAPIDGEIQDNNPLEELARVATLLKEKESAQENVIIKTPTKLNDNVQSLKNCCRGHPYGQVNVTQRKTRFSRQELARPEETENAKRRSPFSQDTEVISRKRLKVTGESSCPYQDKQKKMFSRSGTGPNPLLRHIYEKFAARYMTEPFTPTLKQETGEKGCFGQFTERKKVQPLPISQEIWTDISMDFITDLPKSGVTIKRIGLLGYSYLNGGTIGTSINMTPYEVVYDQPPPRHFPYLHGETMNPEVDRSPPETRTVRYRINHKLAIKFYGPFQVVALIGKVAYILKLPSSAGIHDVFHVSHLKSFHGEVPLVATLPTSVSQHQPVIVKPPRAVIDRRIQKVHNVAQVQYLVQWDGLPNSEETWKDADVFVQ